MNDKSFLRKNMIKIRDAIPEMIRKRKDEKILYKLFNLKSFTNANSVLCYASVRSEVDTKDIISYCLRERITLSMPKVNINSLQIYRIEKIDELQPATFDIPEPTILNDLRRINPTNIDVAIVPGIAFDLQKNRIGYGKGYYDKLLSKSVCLKIALCYEEQIVDFIPTNNHDIKMDVIVTDERIING